LLADGVDAAWAERTVAAMVASPANPTGTLLTADELAALSASCKQHGGSLIVDEIYHGLTYGCDAATALAVDPDVFVINSFSKYFQMTGWRLGWLVVPDLMSNPRYVWRRTCFFVRRPWRNMPRWLHFSLR
jgi:aspartate/methionine/tyrosine aminotransferase